MERNSLIIGNFTYNTNDNIIDLQSILICPELWLGNNSFTDFIGKSVFRVARFEQANSIKLQFPFNNKKSSESAKNIDDFEGAVDLYELHKSTNKLYNGDLKAFAVYNRLFRSNHEELKRIAFNILLSFREHDNISLRLRAVSYTDLTLPTKA